MRKLGLLLVVLLMSGCAMIDVEKLAGEPVSEFWWLEGEQRKTTCPHCKRKGHYRRSYMTKGLWESTYYDVYMCWGFHAWVHVTYSSDFIDVVPRVETNNKEATGRSKLR